MSEPTKNAKLGPLPILVRVLADGETVELPPKHLNIPNQPNQVIAPLSSKCKTEVYSSFSDGDIVLFTESYILFNDSGEYRLHLSNGVLLGKTKKQVPIYSKVVYLETTEDDIRNEDVPVCAISPFRKIV